MAKNVIYCYSGTGNCLDMAKNIAKVLGDTDIIMMRRAPVRTDVTDAERVGFIFPCYAGGLPGEVEKYARSVKVAPDAYTFGIVSYAGYPGCGLYKLNEIIPLKYWNKFSHHCSCIWLFPHSMMLPPLNDEKAQARSEKKAQKFAYDIKSKAQSKKAPSEAKFNQVESKGFAGLLKLKALQFKVTEDCIHCGTCVKLCPKDNIRIVGERAVHGKDCIGCLSCLHYCPMRAVSDGVITKLRARYHNPNVSIAELCEQLIHID